MAGNSVPIWPHKAIKFSTPPGLDICFGFDGSPSMKNTQVYILDENNIRRMETALRSFGVGTRGTNYYNWQGFGKRASEDPEGLPIEDNANYNGRKHYPTVDGVQTLSVPGQAYLDDRVENGIWVNGSENAGVTVNMLAKDTVRFKEENDPLFVMLGNEQDRGGQGGVWGTHATHFQDGLPVPYRYVGVMPSSYSTTGLDPSEDPVPAGSFQGYMWINDTRGVAVYFDGTTINYRFNVLNSNIRINTPSNVWQPYLDRGIVTYGGAFNLVVANLPQIFESIGVCFGKFAYDPELKENE